MKTIRVALFSLLLHTVFHHAGLGAEPRAGFSLPDSVSELTLRYRSVRGLVVLPVTINDSVRVNLILDTGCRNIILFGKKNARLFQSTHGRPVEFSGLGDGRPVKGSLSLGNKVSIHSVLGERIPIVVVQQNNLFARHNDVDGVIGYDIFVKFEVELNPALQSITFRHASKTKAPYGYDRIPLRIDDSRPVMESHVFLNKNTGRPYPLMIDTGSSLGLLLKSTNTSELLVERPRQVLGLGLNGPVTGYSIVSKKIVVSGIEIEGVPTGIVSSDWHDNASIGMDILKDYILVLNYCQAYACLKKIDRS